MINAYINKEERSQVKNNFTSQGTRKEEHIKLKVIRGRKIIKIRAEIHEIEKRKKNREGQQNKRCFWKRYTQLTNP